jgi:hypothetical protein
MLWGGLGRVAIYFNASERPSSADGHTAFGGGVAMRPIQRHLRNQARSLQREFEDLREEQRDPDVKGGGNEEIMATFIERHFSSKMVVLNTSVIDSNDQQSGELDIVVCNEDQPFVSRTSKPELLIAEGVDFVLRVKAILDAKEVKRTIANCKSLKRLKRVHSVNDQFWIDSVADAPFFVERIPYVCIAYSSKLSLSTIADHFGAGCRGIPLEEQPDAIFVLGRGMVLNARSGEGTLAHGHVGFDATDLARMKETSRCWD